jgi:hypothetical protein
MVKARFWIMPFTVVTLCVAPILIAGCNSADTMKRVKEEMSQRRPTTSQRPEIPTAPIPSVSGSGIADTSVNGPGTPGFNPAPERITAIEPLPERALASGPQAFRRKRSVWRDGEVQIDGNWESFYVWTSAVVDHCAVGTATLANPFWYVEYACPEATGQLTITHIDKSGMVISFSSLTGAKGTFHLQSHEWVFSSQ